MASLTFEQQCAIERALDNPRMTIPATCLYCDQPRTITFGVNGLTRTGTPEELANWLDALAAARCPCLGDILFGVGHRGTRRRLVREALEDAELDGLERSAVYAERVEALRSTLAGLQPGA